VKPTNKNELNNPTVYFSTTNRSLLDFDGSNINSLANHGATPLVHQYQCQPKQTFVFPVSTAPALKLNNRLSQDSTAKLLLLGNNEPHLLVPLDKNLLLKGVVQNNSEVYEDIPIGELQANYNKSLKFNNENPYSDNPLADNELSSAKVDEYCYIQANVIDFNLLNETPKIDKLNCVVSKENIQIPASSTPFLPKTQPPTLNEKDKETFNSLVKNVDVNQEEKLNCDYETLNKTYVPNEYKEFFNNKILKNNSAEKISITKSSSIESAASSEASSVSSSLHLLGKSSQSSNKDDETRLETTLLIKPSENHEEKCYYQVPLNKPAGS
jgi:hypothetical protein